MSNYFANKKIVLPYDFSDEANESVDEALKMADDSTELHIVNVVVPIRDYALEAGMTIGLEDDKVRMDTSAGKMADKFGDRSDKIKFATRLGDPGHEINDYASEVGADLIVMPSHGRSGVTRLLLGSVAERVMRHAECPVLILRKPR
ncbi:MAG: universal stress protein [Planctomycetales bacterium]|nr:universal stress protein [Planctomycetales bacterium]